MCIPSDANAATFSDKLLELDAAIEVVDTHDKKDAENEQQSAKHRMHDVKVFKIEYMKKRDELRMAGPPAKKKAKKGPSELPFAIPQKEAKLYVPPGAYIWRGMQRNEWWGHLAPFKRAKAKFTVKSEEQSSLKSTLRQLWSQYCWWKAIDKKEPRTTHQHHHQQHCITNVFVFCL